MDCEACHSVQTAMDKGIQSSALEDSSLQGSFLTASARWFNQRTLTTAAPAPYPVSDLQDLRSRRRGSTR